MGRAELQAEVSPLDDKATDDEKKENANKTAEREKIVKNMQNRGNEVWCILALVLHSTTLMCLRKDHFD